MTSLFTLCTRAQWFSQADSVWLIILSLLLLPAYGSAPLSRSQHLLLGGNRSREIPQLLPGVCWPASPSHALWTALYTPPLQLIFSQKDILTAHTYSSSSLFIFRFIFPKSHEWLIIYFFCLHPASLFSAVVPCWTAALRLSQSSRHRRSSLHLCVLWSVCGCDLQTHSQTNC